MIDEPFRREYIKLIEIKIWNEAVEASAKQAAIAIGEETLLATHTSTEIRKLKQDE